MPHASAFCTYNNRTALAIFAITFANVHFHCYSSSNPKLAIYTLKYDNISSRSNTWCPWIQLDHRQCGEKEKTRLRLHMVIFDLRIGVTSSDHLDIGEPTQRKLGLFAHSQLRCFSVLVDRLVHVNYGRHCVCIKHAGSGGTQNCIVLLGWCRMQCTDTHVGTVSSINRRDICM